MPDRAPAGHRHPARVAVAGPFSGPRADWGRHLDTAISARPWVGWERHDDRGDPATARRAAARIIGDGGFTAVVGHFSSQAAAAVLPMYAAAGLPLLLPLSTAPGLLSGTGGAALRWCPDDDGQVSAIRRAAAEAGCARVTAIDDGSSYGRALAARFGDDTPGDGPAATVVCGTHHGAARVVRYLHATGRPGPVFCTDDCATDEFAGLTGHVPVRVACLSGGPQWYVDAAFDALTAALRDGPRTGEELLAAVRRRATVAFDADGDRDDLPAGAGWDVIP